MTPLDGAPPMATPRVAAGVLYLDRSDRLLLVKPSYKAGWDLPGGYVEPGESPHAAACREVTEELGAPLAVGELLVVDWAPHPEEGDKLLFVFAGGVLDNLHALHADGTEVIDIQFHPVEQLSVMLPDRLAHRVSSALAARRGGPHYLEHGHSTLQGTGPNP